MSREVVIELPKFNKKQEAVFSIRANELLIAGDTRSGKSFLTRKKYILFCSQIPGLVTDILRLNHEDVIKNYMGGETGFPVLLRAWEREGLCKINQDSVQFWNDSVITLGHAADDKVARKHQGNTVHMRTIDEAAQLPEARLRALTGWVTMTSEMKSRVPEKWRDMLPCMQYLTNFIGPGMGFFRREFLEVREPFEIEKVGQFKRIYVPMFLTDNPHESAQDTIARIKQSFPDPATQKALLECNWRAPTGDYYPEWSEPKHVVPNFTPPTYWFKFRTFDWGSAEPFAVLWWCISDGSTITDSNGEELWFPAGSLIAYREWYGCMEDDTSKGLRMRNHDIAQGIINRTPESTSNITVSDGFPFSDRGESRSDDSKKTHTIADVFAENGVPLIRNKLRRVQGWSKLRDRLIGLDGIPLFYCVEKCQFIRNYFPALARNPHDTEDAVENGEATHIMDICRLAASAAPPVRTAPSDKDIAKKSRFTPAGIKSKLIPSRKNILK